VLASVAIVLISLYRPARDAETLALFDATRKLVNGSPGSDA
jgi:hypothetical protein